MDWSSVPVIGVVTVAVLLLIFVAWTRQQP
jgi:hypothetical protein